MFLQPVRSNICTLGLLFLVFSSFAKVVNGAHTVSFYAISLHYAHRATGTDLRIISQLLRPEVSSIKTEKDRSYLRTGALDLLMQFICKQLPSAEHS